MILGTWVLLGVYSTGCGVGKWLSVATSPVWHWCTPQGCRSSSLQKMHRSHWSIHQLCGINFLKICDPTQHWPKFEKLFLHHLYFFSHHLFQVPHSWLLMLRASCLKLEIAKWIWMLWGENRRKWKRPAGARSPTQDTSGLSRQCSATEPWQPDNHQPSQSSICTTQVVLNASVAHLAATQYVPSELR